MINQAISDYILDRGKLVYVGDEQKDFDAAMNANIFGVLVAGEGGTASEKRTLKEAFDLISEYIS
jgi:histidinol phosphatase-like enzyme